MRPTINFLISTFDWANEHIFGGSLQRPFFRISNSRRYLGQLRSPSDAPLALRSSLDCCLSLSGYYDLDREQLVDTVIHEMIHLKIYLDGCEDTSTHGEVFCHIMNDINLRYKRNITVRTKLSDEARETGYNPSGFYICLLEMTDGSQTVASVGRSSIFRLHRVFSEWNKVKSLSWFWTTDGWWSRFPKIRTPKCFHASADELNMHLLSAVRCKCENGRFFPISE